MQYFLILLATEPFLQGTLNCLESLGFPGTQSGEDPDIPKRNLPRPVSSLLATRIISNLTLLGVKEGRRGDRMRTRGCFCNLSHP